MKFTAFAAFIRRLGWSFFAHFKCLQCLGALGRDPCGVYSVGSFLLGIGVGHLWCFSAFVVYNNEGCRRVFIFYLLLYFLRGVACSIYGALG